jgi:1-acyl-sn-glycerol-3-phosphate acyltransferase
VHRGLGDVEAVETAVALAREGHVVVMFPEGTRRTKGLVKKHRARPRSGAARIALEAGVPLVPAAVAGTNRLLALGPLRVAYGPPLEIDDLRSGPDFRRASQEATERLMSRIAELEKSL